MKTIGIELRELTVAEMKEIDGGLAVLVIAGLYLLGVAIGIGIVLIIAGSGN